MPVSELKKKKAGSGKVLAKKEWGYQSPSTRVLLESGDFVSSLDGNEKKDVPFFERGAESLRATMNL